MRPFVSLSICGLSLAIVAVLIGCGGDKGSGDSQPEDGGRIGYVELDEGGEACLNKWNEPRNADAQAMAASSYPDTYTAVSFYEPVDSSNDCVAMIAYPGYDNAAQFVSTAGAFEPFPSVTGQINEVVAEPLPWNALLDADGMAQPRIEDGVPFDGIEPDAQMCVDSWNQDLAAPGTISNTAGISGVADVGTDTQFPNRCLITVEFSDPVLGDSVTQWRDGSALGSSEWNLIASSDGGGPSLMFVEPIDPVSLKVRSNGVIVGDNPPGQPSGEAEDASVEGATSAERQPAPVTSFAEGSEGFELVVEEGASLSPAFQKPFGKYDDSCGLIDFGLGSYDGGYPNEGIGSIRVEGISCESAIGILMTWLEGEGEGAPSGWRCYPDGTGNTATPVICEREAAEIRFSHF